MRLEHWIYTIPLRLRSLRRRNQVEREESSMRNFSSISYSESNRKCPAARRLTRLAMRLCERCIE